MHITPDQIIFWQYGFVKINATIAITWFLMAVLIVSAKFITRNLSVDKPITRWRNLVEIIVLSIKKQIEEIGLHKSEKYLPFIGTIFLFIFIANLFTIFPFYEPPTSSLSTTAALAICVFAAVPYYGISEQGLSGYFKSYMKPTPIMFPFHIISEFTRTLALAVRLFGNMMSGVMLIAILLTITPFFFPIIMCALGLLIGSVQAYIFSVLATVFIAAATKGESD